MRMPYLSGRTASFRVVAIVVLLGLVVAACGGTDDGASETTNTSTPDTSDTGDVTSTELVVNSQGFAESALTEYVVPMMEDEYGVTVTLSSSLSSEALATAIAQQSNPEIDVFMLDEGPWLQGKDSGVWAELDASAIPNLDGIPERFIDPDLRGVGYGSLVLGMPVRKMHVYGVVFAVDRCTE